MKIKEAIERTERVIMQAKDTLLADARDTTFTGEDSFTYVIGKIDITRNRLEDALRELRSMKKTALDFYEG